jgi:hypothetical protein
MNRVNTTSCATFYGFILFTLMFWITTAQAETTAAESYAGGSGTQGAP